MAAFFCVVTPIIGGTVRPLWTYFPKPPYITGCFCLTGFPKSGYTSSVEWRIIKQVKIVSCLFERNFILEELSEQTKNVGVEF